MTALAIQIGLHAAAIPGAYRRDALADRDHLDAQFMPGYPRVGEEGHFAQVASEVSTANAHLMHPDHRITRARR
jgi:hypothetical protein